MHEKATQLLGGPSHPPTNVHAPWNHKHNMHSPPHPTHLLRRFSAWGCGSPKMARTHEKATRLLGSDTSMTRRARQNTSPMPLTSPARVDLLAGHVTGGRCDRLPSGMCDELTPPDQHGHTSMARGEPLRAQSLSSKGHTGANISAPVPAPMSPSRGNDLGCAGHFGLKAHLQWTRTARTPRTRAPGTRATRGSAG